MSDLHRMGHFAVIAAALLGTLYVLSPDQLPVALWKLTLVTLAGYVGYWLDRGLFPYARPDATNIAQSAQVFSAAMIRRAIVVAATVIATAIGL